LGQRKPPFAAEVELLKNGTLEARTSSAEAGQGLSTVLQLIVAEEFNLSVSLLEIHLMDTNLTPNGRATNASRQTFVSGNAVRQAARNLLHDHGYPGRKIRSTAIRSQLPKRLRIGKATLLTVRNHRRNDGSQG
jgi:CO/xanthine dehydrogenase Mo-binding subunit